MALDRRVPSAGRRRVVALGILAAFAWLLGCLDAAGPRPGRAPQSPSTPPPTPLIVSAPVLPPAAALAHAATATLVGGDSVVFVSAPPGSFPGGAFATIRNRTTGSAVTTPVIDGGFDPVPVKAVVGDSLEISVTTTAGIRLLQAVVSVRAHQPPVVVRTSPPGKKTDVPVNSLMSVVFSEPVIPTSVTTASLTLLQGSTAVGASVQVTDPLQFVAVLTPAAMLRPHTSYQLLVSTGVHGIDGLALNSADTVSFTTGDSVSSSIASVTITPSFSDTIRTLGDTFRLTAVARDTSGGAVPGAVIDWSTSNASMPFVVQAGGGTSFYTNRRGTSVVMTPYVSGSTIVRASAGAASTTVTVNVSQRLAGLVFTLDGSVPAGDSVELLTSEYRELSVFAADAHGYPMQGTQGLVPTLSSSDSSIAGLVSGTNEASAPALFLTAGKPGVANVIATLATSAAPLMDTMRVSVILPPPVATVVLAPHGVRGVVGGVIDMAATVAAASGRILGGRQVTWSISDPAVATVDTVPGSQTLLVAVTGHASGVVTITATSEGQTASEAVAFDVVAFGAQGLAEPCALSVSGVAYCWGQGSYGSLGDGSTISNPTPVAVHQGDLTFVALSASGQHTCGLTGGGVPYCWGLNVYGQLGTGPSANCVYYDGVGCRSLTPVAVAGGLTFSSIAAAGLHTCAITGAGVAYCWGHNADGETGIGLTDGVTYTPTAVQTALRFTSISAAYGETCGLIADGHAFCWGDNGYGQLGDGSTTVRTAPSAVSGGLRFSVVSTGGAFACGLAVGDGAAYCWGVDQFGQLGSAAGPCDAYQDIMPCSPQPVAVAGGIRFVAVSAGGGQACGLTSAGAAYCWGYNAEGQLGAGFMDGGAAAVTHPVPLPVVGGHTFATVIAGEGSTCGLTTAGELYCWGLLPAPHGPQGLPMSAVPVKVVGQP
jgi:alpha-tubulin suppressor-like RCC1 family protein